MEAVPLQMPGEFDGTPRISCNEWRYVRWLRRQAEDGVKLTGQCGQMGTLGIHLHHIGGMAVEKMRLRALLTMNCLHRSLMMP